MSINLHPVAWLSSRLCILAASLSFVVFAGCAQRPVDLTAHEMLNATLWQHTSAEYECAVQQAYRLAQDNLDKALADPQMYATEPKKAADFAKLRAQLADQLEAPLDPEEAHVGVPGLRGVRADAHVEQSLDQASPDC